MAEQMIEIGGVTKNITGWCEQNGINHTTYLARLKRGWSQERALATPTHKRRVCIPMCTEHTIWRHMWSRCVDPKNNVYARYGGSGITVCDRWKDFFVFVEDMGRRPSKRHSLDRIDNFKGYAPDNCRWATHQEQVDNRRCNNLIEIDGETKTLSAWAREYGVSRATVQRRYAEFQDWGKAIESSCESRVKQIVINANGQEKTLTEWAKELGVEPYVIHGRLRSGWSHEDAVTTPKRDVDLNDFARRLNDNDAKSKVITVTIDGVTKTARAWAKELGIISFGVAWTRVSRDGWDWERALTTPPTDASGRNYRTSQIEIDGVTKGFREWCREYGVNNSTVWKRMKRGMSFEDALKQPVATK